MPYIHPLVFYRNRVLISSPEVIHLILPEDVYKALFLFYFKLKENKFMKTLVEELIGKTIIDIQNNIDELVFTCSDNSVYKMYHIQDCCESVSIEDIVGDLDDLIGSPILKASEDISDVNPDGIKKDYQDSFTWTFYNFATIKGYVTIRWYGESNGYYSETVDFVKL